jgi:hypothetical protein
MPTAVLVDRVKAVGVRHFIFRQLLRSRRKSVSVGTAGGGTLAFPRAAETFDLSASAA